MDVKILLQGHIRWVKIFVCLQFTFPCWKANKSETLNSPHQTREGGHMEAGLRKLQKRRVIGIAGQELYTSSTSADLWMSLCPDLQADLREYVHIRGTFEVPGFRVWGDGSLILRSRLVHGEPARSIPWLISHSPSLSAAAFHWWSFQGSVSLWFLLLEYLSQRERERERERDLLLFSLNLTNHLVLVLAAQLLWWRSKKLLNFVIRALHMNATSSTELRGASG
jgi:hypothetical protein